MGSLFGGGSTPAPAPQRDDSAVKAEAEKQRKIAAQKKGRKSTILTGGTGVTEDAPIRKKKLLGQ